MDVVAGTQKKKAIRADGATIMHYINKKGNACPLSQCQETTDNLGAIKME